jgi:DMSO reductase anchor subunit
MRRTPWSRLVWIAVVAANVAYLALRVAESRGVTLPAVPLISSLVVLVIGGVVVVLGRQVRQYTQGVRRRIDPLLAARTVVLAKASAHTGALLSGWYAGQVLLVVSDLDVPARRDVAVTAGLALLCTVALAVVGLVVERWCEISPQDGEEEDGETSAASGSPV